MSEFSSPTVEIQHWLDRLRAGDKSARDKLLGCASQRLLRLTRKMLKDYPSLARWEQTDDVLQNASLRLSRALQQVSPTDARHFFRIAANHIRWELRDLARRYSGPLGAAAHHATPAGADQAGRADGGALEPVGNSDAPSGLMEWSEFHEKVALLPETEREVFDLLWYQGLTQAEAAILLQVSVRTIKRHWQAARLRLQELLGDDARPR